MPLQQRPDLDCWYQLYTSLNASLQTTAILANYVTILNHFGCDVLQNQMNYYDRQMRNVQNYIARMGGAPPR